MNDEERIEIPWDAVDPDTLHRLVEEFVTREGTDYGEVEYDLNTKVQQILHGLKRRQWTIIYDPVLQSTHIIDAAEWQRENKRKGI